MSSRRGIKKTSEILKPYLITVIVAAAAMVFFIILWLFVGPQFKRDVSAQATVSESNVQTEVTAQEDVSGLLKTPQPEDGTGRAGIMQLTEEMYAVSSEAGKYSNETGMWYAPSDGCCFYNGWVTLDGNKYHFDANGYMDTGWKYLNEEGCYFDENGVYDPDKDSSMMIALTFDDGPSQYTSEILDILDENDVKSTFMMLGSMIEQYGADVVPREMAAGHTIGNHSYDHANMLNLTSEQVVEEFTTTDNILASYGATASVVRFPYGNYSSELVAAVGRPQIYWDVDSRDWESRDATTIISTVLSELQPGGIILVHETYPETVEAIRTLIPQLKSEGYEFVNIETLAAAKGYELKSGVTYFSFKQKNIDEGRVTDE